MANGRLRQTDKMKPLDLQGFWHAKGESGLTGRMLKLLWQVGFPCTADASFLRLCAYGEIGAMG
jgi:hypothetical protein